MHIGTKSANAESGNGQHTWVKNHRMCSFGPQVQHWAPWDSKILIRTAP